MFLPSRWAVGLSPVANTGATRMMAASIATVHAALDAGINFFDTAEGYEAGHSERVLGRGLLGRRAEAIIATKVSPNHLAPDEVITACEGSLRNLQTDYIDLYQISLAESCCAIGRHCGALAPFEKNRAKFRAIGVSNFAVLDFSEMLALSECETNQTALQFALARDRTGNPAALCGT